MSKTLIAGFALLFALPLCAQDASDTPSLGDVARQSRNTNSPKAKVVLNEDNTKPKLVIPDVALEGDRNDAAIMAAYRGYADNHTRQETDEMLRKWYDQQVATFNAMKATYNNAMRGYLDSSPNEPYDQSADPAKANQQFLARQADARADQKKASKTQDDMTGLVAALVRLQAQLDPKHEKYAWFDPYFALKQ